MKASQTEPYAAAKTEYSRKITRELVERHKEEYRKKGMRLRSAILFGPLAGGDYDEEIRLLEIAEGYPYPAPGPEPSAIQFQSTAQFPMFGHLRLWVMSPREFRDAIQEGHPFIAELRTEPKEYLLDEKQFVQKLVS